MLSIFLSVLVCHSAPARAAVSYNDDERDIIERLNDYRKDNGRKKFVVSKKLTKAATYMAEHMGSSGDDPAGKTVSERAADYDYTGTVEENLAVGYETAKDVVDGWKGSDTHKGRMLSKSYKAVGCAFDKRKDSYKWYWSCVFGTKKTTKDLLAESDYAPNYDIQVKVTDANKKAIKGAKVKAYVKDGTELDTLDTGTTNAKGKTTLTVEKQSGKVYIHVTATGYTAYTKSIANTRRSVTLWLER